MDLGAGQVLQLDGDVLRDVAHPRALLEPRDEAAAPAERAGVVLQAGQQREERRVEARDGVGRELLEHAQVDEHADDRRARPELGPRRTRVSRMRSVGCGVPLAVASAAGGACVIVAVSVGGRQLEACGDIERAQHGRSDALAPVEVEAVARRQRVQDHVADHQRLVGPDLPRVGLGLRAVDDR